MKLITALVLLSILASRSALADEVAATTRAGVPGTASAGGSKDMRITRSGTQPSQKAPVEWFTGSVRVDPLFQASDPSRASGASVTFEQVGVVGLGGLGHMATKVAAAMGAEVTVLTTSRSKVDDARRFGAKTVIVNDNGADLSKHRRSLDFILDTVPYQHNLERLIPLLRMDSTLCIVGVGKINEPHQIGPFSLLRDRTSLASSAIGGIRETQELVHFCALHGIRPEITKVPISRIDDAWAKVVDKAARYRFVIDMTNA